MRSRKAIGVLLGSLLLVGCGTSPLSGPLKGAADFAIASDQDHCKNKKWECKDFRVTCYKELEVSDADKANGIDQKWCLQINFIHREKPDDQWKDNPWLPLGVRVIRKRGNWEKDGDFFQSFCECKKE